MSANDAIVVPREVWETAFACFAGHVGLQMHFRAEMPQNWAEVFRFACDAETLERLGVPERKAEAA